MVNGQWARPHIKISIWIRLTGQLWRSNGFTCEKRFQVKKSKFRMLRHRRRFLIVGESSANSRRRAKHRWRSRKTTTNCLRTMNFQIIQSKRQWQIFRTIRLIRRQERTGRKVSLVNAKLIRITIYVAAISEPAGWNTWTNPNSSNQQQRFHRPSSMLSDSVGPSTSHPKQKWSSHSDGPLPSSGSATNHEHSSNRRDGHSKSGTDLLNIDLMPSPLDAAKRKTLPAWIR